jgi:putative redox protein
MVKISVSYQGDKHCSLIHEPSGSNIETDAPKDNQGKGEKFSPTDLMGASLASCILTTMAIVAERDGLSLVGGRAEVQKVMISDPRRIGSLRTTVYLPETIPLNYRKKLENAAHHCPVHKSLHPDIDASIEVIYSINSK